MAQLIEVKIPDIGNFDQVPVIEINVQPGDSVAVEDTLLVLESDKATLEVPSPVAGIVKEIRAKVGDKVAEGVLIAIVESSADSATDTPAAASSSAASAADFPVEPATAATTADAAAAAAPSAAPATAQIATPVSSPAVAPSADMIPLNAVGIPLRGVAPSVFTPPPPIGELAAQAGLPHASPSIRHLARRLGVDLTQVCGSGAKGRILREDVEAHVKAVMNGTLAAAAASGGGLDLLPWPKVDFTKFGDIESRPLSRIKKISGANLARNWAMIPHVTQFDSVDITALEDFRQQLNKENEKSGSKVKLTLLAFLIKASVAALQRFPEFNASLDGQGDEMRLILKKYVHIGFAADTPNGLVVPVIRNVDQKGVLEIATEMSALSQKARDGKLSPADMQGGCFSISSLGGIGGTAFTPIINAPEVAILGVSKSEIQPRWNGDKFKPRLMLPLSLSYDHRVIDGAAAARFTTYLGQLLADMRRVLL